VDGEGLAQTYDVVPAAPPPDVASLVSGVDVAFVSIFTSAIEVAGPVCSPSCSPTRPSAGLARGAPAQRLRRLASRQGAVGLLLIVASLPFAPAGWPTASRAWIGDAMHMIRAALMAGDKTEAPTPKKLERRARRARSPRSADLNGAVVLLVGLIGWAWPGGDGRAHPRGDAQLARPGLRSPVWVSGAGSARCLKSTLSETAARRGAGRAGVRGGGVVVNVGQTGFKPRLSGLSRSSEAQPRRRLKQIYASRRSSSWQEPAQVSVVAAIVVAALLRRSRQMAGMVGGGPAGAVGPLTPDRLGARAPRCVRLPADRRPDFVYQKQQAQEVAGRWTSRSQGRVQAAAAAAR